jgi:hypothetical protein
MTKRIHTTTTTRPLMPTSVEPVGVKPSPPSSPSNGLHLIEHCGEENVNGRQTRRGCDFPGGFASFKRLNSE